MKKSLFAFAAAAMLLCSATNLQAQKRAELAPGPTMGWNSWNWFGKHEINEYVVLEVIDAIAESGLKEAGYEYVVIDGGWRDTKLADDGSLLAHPEKFPHGIKFLADYAHSKGLKFGLHTVPGNFDCGNDPVGGYGREELHVRQFVEWGLDFIKLDRCKFAITKDKARGWTEDLTHETYAKWSKLLHDCGRDIVLSVSAYTYRPWNPELCNMSRTTGDIRCRYTGGAEFEKGDLENRRGGFRSVMEIVDQNEPNAPYAGNGYWNDMDMLAIGEQGMTEIEQEAHFALWCIMSSPLFLGNDPRMMTPHEVAMITNRECIAVNQDPSGQGQRVVKEGPAEVWIKKMSDGSHALLLLNRSHEACDIRVDFAALELPEKLKLRDIYRKKNLGRHTAEFTHHFDARGCLFLLAE